MRWGNLKAFPTVQPSWPLPVDPVHTFACLPCPSRRIFLIRALASLMVLAAIAFTSAYAAGPFAQNLLPFDYQTVGLPPGPGKLPVACSYVGQDFTRVAPGQSAAAYWEGEPVDGRNPYITELLIQPAASMRYSLPLPNDPGIYVKYAGQTIDYVSLVCYPTTPDNPRADFILPGGYSVPKMQQPEELPLIALDQATWPVLVYSHGLGGSPLGKDDLRAIVRLAGYGYIVSAPFHADARFLNINIEDLGDALWLLANYPRAAEAFAIRARSVTAALDRLLGDPAYAQRIDASRIGGLGASLGGLTLMIASGAKLTMTLGLSSRQIQQDRRFKAIAGLVPYSGQRLLPAFGEDQNGVDGLTIPYMAIGGSEDKTAPLSLTRQMVNRLSGPRYVISLTGIAHKFDPGFEEDLYGWAMPFFAAYLQQDLAARARLQRMVYVAGGNDEILELEATPPSPALPSQVALQEMRNASLDFFAPARLFEIAPLAPSWQPLDTGFNLVAADPLALPAAGYLPVCSFLGSRIEALNTRYMTADPAICAFGKTLTDWFYEGSFGFATLPEPAGCPDATLPVFRAYNGRASRGEINHRLTTRRSEYLALWARGWVTEGVAFCAQP